MKNLSIPSRETHGRGEAVSGPTSSFVRAASWRIHRVALALAVLAMASSHTSVARAGESVDREASELRAPVSLPFVVSGAEGLEDAANSEETPRIESRDNPLDNPLDNTHRGSRNDNARGPLLYRFRNQRSTLRSKGQPNQTPSAIPFVHRVGDHFLLRIEREIRSGEPRFTPRASAAPRLDRSGQSDGSASSLPRGHVFSADIEAHVVSPYRDGYLVELRWLALQRDNERIDCVPASEANEVVRDSVGGGILRLAVQTDGTATSILNWLEVRDALIRSHRRHAGASEHDEMSPASIKERKLQEEALFARAFVEPVMLGDWNQMYAACGVRLRPGVVQTRRVAVPTTASPQATLPALDRQSLNVQLGPKGLARGLVFVSEKSIGASHEGVSKDSPAKQDRLQRMLPGGDRVAALRVDERVEIHFDLASRRVHGTRRRDLRTNATTPGSTRRAVELLRFMELASPTTTDSSVLAHDFAKPQ